MKRKVMTFILVITAFASYAYNETFTIKEINLEMIKCPDGSFMMGSLEEELGRVKGEELHLVTITKPFYIGKYEITQSQYSALMNKNPSNLIGDSKFIL